MRKNITVSGYAAISMAVCIALVVGGLCEQANAAVEQLQSGIISKIEDNDYEKLIKGSDPITGLPNVTANVIQPGDFLLAIAEFPDFLNANTNVNYASFTAATTMLTGVSLNKVKTVVGAGTSAVFATFGAPTPAEWAAAGLPGPTAASGTVLQVYDDPIGTHLPGLVGLTTASGIAAVTNGTLQWEFGFTGAGGTAVGGQFLTASAADNIPQAGPLPNPDAANITYIDSFTLFANLDATYELNPGQLGGHDFLGFGKGLHDLQLQGNLGTGGSFPAGSFDIHTDTDAYIQIVPEPLSAAVWLLLATCGACCAYRRGART